LEAKSSVKKYWLSNSYFLKYLRIMNLSIKNKIFRIVFLLLFVTLPMSAQNTYYVTESGNGTKEGNSWANASGNLLYAIENTVSGDTVWVAVGTYYGGFDIKEGVQVYGGFSGVETRIDQRKLPGSGRNLTILDGDFTYRVLTQAQSFITPTVWDGFIIQNGRATQGGGVYLRENGVIRRSVIRDNCAGLPSVGEYLPKQGGVVFRTDNETSKAWVIAAENHGRNFQMGINMPNPIISFTDAKKDMNGQTNTQSLSSARAAQVLKNYRAEMPAQDFDDWYIPSAGEWALFFDDKDDGTTSLVYKKVEETLLSNNKTTLEGNKYWTSTSTKQGGMSSAWYVNFKNNNINGINAWQYNKVRGARIFETSTDDGRGGAVFATTGSRLEGCLIYNNISAYGSALFARGTIAVINSTISGNKSETSTVNSTSIDANTGVELINSIVTANTDASYISSNYDKDIAYKTSAIETSENLVTGNIRLEGVLEPEGVKFIDFENENFRLSESSPCFLVGNADYIPVDLDTDLEGNKRIGDNGTSIGAFEPSTILGLGNESINENIQIYPNPVKAGAMFVLKLNSSKQNFNKQTIEIRNVLGVLDQSLQAQEVNNIQAPNVAGLYIVRILEESRVIGEYKIIVY